MTFTETVLLALDLLGTFVFAVSGVLLAARRNFDITGGLVLGILAGIGGGIIRDILLDRVPNALAHPVYLAPPLVATLLIYFIGQRTFRARIWIIVFDALGMGLFSLTGTAIALEADSPPAVALLMGALTACGGGLLRDVVANEDPAIFRGTDLYLIPALFGSGLTILAERVGLLGGITRSSSLPWPSGSGCSRGSCSGGCRSRCGSGRSGPAKAGRGANGCPLSSAARTDGAADHGP